jgi:ABC-type nitrate/sulfonate/bicarbonate transport system substrate-binding protein
MRRLLAAHGLHSGDFGVKIVEGTPARWGCLRRGECDAVVLGQPQDLQAIEQGYRLLGLSNSVVPNFLYTVTAARRSWAEAHKDAVTRYVRAMAATFAFIRNPANREHVIEAIVASTGASETIASKTLDLICEPEHAVLPRRAEIDVEGLQQVVAMMGEAGTLAPPLPPAGRFVELEYLRAAGVQ